MVAVDGPAARGAIAEVGHHTKHTTSVGVVTLRKYTFDKDWFQVTLQAGRTYRIDLAPVIHVRDDGTYAVPLLPEIVAIYAPDSDYLHHTSDRESSGPGYAARVDFTPRSSGDYYISAAGLGFTAGEYELRVATSRSRTTSRGPAAAVWPARGCVGYNSRLLTWAPTRCRSNRPIRCVAGCRPHAVGALASRESASLIPTAVRRCIACAATVVPVTPSAAAPAALSRRPPRPPTASPR